MSKQPATPATATPNEIPCPECGEMVRKQLIRCWNCGAFMHKKIEAKYQEMQANPAPIVFSLPEGEAVVADDDDDMGFQLQQAPAVKSSPKAKETPAATPSPEKTKSVDDEGPQTPHSIATGGDALLDIAMQEEAESQKRRKKRRAFVGGAKTPGGFIIFCPYGCHIEVKDSHRGMTGKCPKCRAPFIVPVGPPEYVKKETAEKEEEQAPVQIHWMENLHLHVVNPEKLKLKADSLAKEFVDADVAFLTDGLVVATQKKGGGGSLLSRGGGADAKKKGDPRDALRQHFAEGKPAGEFSGGEAIQYPREALEHLRVVQPVANRGASMFAGIPVFGEHRIAVQLPVADEKADPRYLSMGLLQFRKFSDHLQEHFLITGLGKDSSIPMEDSYQEYKCHYMDVPIKALKNLEWYKADPTAELTVAGYRCGSCGLAVCEAARNKEKLGGKGGKGIAKVKCPKCGQKMGENPLYSLAASVTQPAMSGEQPAAESSEPAKAE